jgi:hypothetical protein
LWAVLCVPVFSGIWLIGNQISTDLFKRRPVALPVLFILLALLVFVLNLPAANKRGYTGAMDYAREVLNLTEPDAMLVTASDNDIYTLWYAHYVMGIRPDVIIVGANFLSSDWYESFFTDEEKQKYSLPIKQRAMLSREQFYSIVLDQLVEPNSRNFPVYLTFYDPYMEMKFKKEWIAESLYDDDDPAQIDSFMPLPFLLRLQKK